jgi:hypothetical protein
LGVNKRFNETPTSRRSITAVLMGLSLVNVGVFAQPPKKPSTPQPIGQDIESVIKRLIASGATRPKSEFETTEQYEKRVSLALDRNQLLFLLPVGEEDGDVVSFKYDADQQTMAADLWGVMQWLVRSDNTSKENPPHFQVEVKRRLLSSRQYLGSNAFGVNKTISFKEFDEFGLALDNNGMLSQEHPTFTWPMTVEEARLVKPFLRVAVRCVQNAPGVYTDLTHGEPSIDWPKEFVNHLYYLPVLVEEVWILDFRSGKLVKKFDSDSGNRHAR